MRKYAFIPATLIILFLLIYFLLPGCNIVREALNKDTTPPTVLSVSPKNGEENVPINTSVIVEFSESMNEDTTERAFTILPSVQGTFSWSEQSTVMTFTPKSYLAEGETYTAMVGTDAKDTAGNDLEDAYVWIFKTASGSQIDTTPPGEVSGFTATAGDGEIQLSWSNPDDPDFAGVVLVYRTDRYPQAHDDGTEIYTGSGTSFTHTGLTNGTTYYYTIFTYDGALNYSNGVQANATPSGTRTWVQVNTNGFGDSTNAHSNMIIFGDYIYVFTSNGTNWRTQDGINWEQIDLPFTTTAQRLTVYNNQLYIATTTADSEKQIWRSSDGLRWENVFSDTLGGSGGWLFDGCVYNGYIYVGGQTNSICRILRSSTGDLGTWTQVASDDFGDSNNGDITDLIVYNNAMYVSIWNTVNGGRVYKTTDGINYNQVTSNGFGNPSYNDAAYKMIIYNNELYVGTYTYNDGCQVWKNPGDDTWIQVNTNGFGGLLANDSNNMTGVWDFAVLNNELYAGAGGGYTSGSHMVPYIFKYLGGTSWELINSPGFGYNNNGRPQDMVVFNNFIYLCTRYSDEGIQVWRY